MWTNYYQDSNLGVSNHIFERADRLVDQIMGSTQQPQEYGALTARIYLFKVGDPFSVANDLKDKGMYMCFMFDMPGGRGKVGWGVKSYVRYVTFLDMKNNQQTHALLRYNFGRCPPSEISFPNNQTISYLSTPQDTWDGHSTGWVGDKYYSDVQKLLGYAIENSLKGANVRTPSPTYLYWGGMWAKAPSGWLRVGGPGEFIAWQ